MKKERKRNWAERRVLFMVSDDWHALHTASVKMPVRVKEMGIDMTTYEGPIAARWAKLQQEAPEFCNERQLVGVLVAGTDALREGQITWLVQSETKTNEVEEGADRIAVDS